jgi:uncharacterized short protein YbdD (DUF466 family)
VRRRARQLLLGAASALRDIVRGAAGADAYGHYRDHLERHHPERQPLTREEFFRREFSARWDGIRRCC